MRFTFLGHELIFRKMIRAKELTKRIKVKKGRERGYKMCPTMGKRMLTREQAVEQRDKIKASYLRIYMCEFCNWWHLTHKKQHS